MKEFLTKMVPVAPSDRFPFRCRMCGACCRHVRESVPLESLETGELCRLIDEAAARRGDAAALEENVRKLRAIEHRSMETAARLLGKEVQEIC